MINNQIKGRRIGRYELIEEIGRGGMAVVYRALDTMLDRVVAIKVLHPHLSSHQEARERFHREARAVARLKHANVLEIYDYSDVEGVDVFIVMELVEGISMRKYLDQNRGEPISAEAVALVMRPVVAALAHAHANGIVHRDVKPENILIGGQGTIKLSDFGIAHLAGVSQMTATGQILGSPAYMSPDHIELEELDARADIFSVGTVLYELAIGRAPFEGPNPHAIIKKIVEGQYRDPLSCNPAVGHDLSQIIKRCLKAAPKDRYANADELVSALDSLLHEMSIEPGDDALNEYFKDPEIWNGKCRQEIISKTLNKGMTARRQRDLQAAINHFNRVLALEPGNEKAIRAVMGMGRQRRARRLLERGLMVLPLIIAVAALVWASVRAGEPETAVPETVAPLADKEPGSDTSLTLKTLSTISDSSTLANPSLGPNKKPTTERDGELVPDDDEEPVDPAAQPTPKKKRKPVSRSPFTAAPKTRVVIFTPQPMAVQIVIDDGERFPFGPAHRKKEVRVGKHNITFLPNDPKRFYPKTWQVSIPAGTEPYQFRGRLRWRPAKLLIESNVPEAAVTVPGKATDRVNHTFEVPISEGPTEQISVLVSAEDYVPRTRTVEITAGELTRIRVTLVEAK